jgi:SOS-response transcriptional repressor LexA
VNSFSVPACAASEKTLILQAVLTSTTVRPRRPTGRQQEVLDAIREHFLLHGSFPTIRGLAASLGIASTNAVVCHLNWLARKGWLERIGEFGVTRANWKLSDELKQPWAVKLTMANGIVHRITQNALSAADACTRAERDLLRDLGAGAAMSPSVCVEALPFVASRPADSIESSPLAGRAATPPRGGA